MKMSVSAKLLVSSIINVVLVLALAGLSYWTIERLRMLQDDGAEISRNALDATKAAALGAEMYQIIADAVINRDFAATEQDWAEKKAEAAQDLEKLASTVDTEAEKANVALAKDSVDGLVTLFETEMLPLLKTDISMDPRIQELDGRIDVHASTLADSLTKVRKSMDAEATEADVDFDATGQRSSVFAVSIAVAAVVVALIIAFLLSRIIASPIRNMTEAMRMLAGGNTSAEIPARNRADEIGEMASAVQVFKENMIETDRLRAEQEANKERSEAGRKKMLRELADKFEKSVGEVVAVVSSAGSELQSTARALSSTAEEAAQQSNAVAAASEEMTQNIQTVASATEELSASIGEIGHQVNESTSIVSTAVGQAEDTNAKVQTLAEAAKKIGDVVTLINDIASQTNLLALNATIEAARAGEAGKGFAVVASEVKNLASQTANATDEIGAQIKFIQDSTNASAAAIQEITQTINRVNEISTTIASAVEEQGAATMEISRNVQQASAGASEVSSNISGVTQASQQTSTGSAEVLTAASELARNGDRLKSEVAEFLRTVRAL